MHWLFFWLFGSACQLGLAAANTLVDIHCDPCIDRESVRIRAIVHGTSGDGFWQQVQLAMRQAARDMRITLESELYRNYSDAQMAEDIRNAADAGAWDGLVVTIPSDIVQEAVAYAAPKIPIFGLNSGSDRQVKGVLGFVAMDEYLGGVMAAQEFLSTLPSFPPDRESLTGLFINHEKDNHALTKRFEGFKDTLLGVADVKELTDVMVDVKELTDVGLVDSYMKNCPYDVILLAGSQILEDTLSALRLNDCMQSTSLATFDLNTRTYDAIVVGDLAFVISQQHHLQGTMSVVMSALYATTGKSLARSSTSEFGSYTTGPRLVNLQNLPGDTIQSCEQEAFPVCGSFPLPSVEQEEVEENLLSQTGSCPCTDRSKIKIGGVLHGVATDRFWDVVFAQAYQAADDLGVELLLDRIELQPSAETLHAKMASKMISLCRDGVDGLFVTIPSDRVLAAIRECQSLNVPVMSINSGAMAAKELGLIHHISQLEYEAGFAAGQRLALASGMKEAVCLDIERGNTATEKRCQGFFEATGQAEITSGGTVFLTEDNAAINVKAIEGHVNRTGNWKGVGFLVSGQKGADHIVELKSLHPELIAGTFDMNDAIYRGLDDGVFLFAIDQNQFFQGYMPVWLLTLFASNKQYLLNTFIESGPRFVEQSPSRALQHCDSNNFEVCPRPMDVILIDNLLGPGILAFGYIAVGISWALGLYFLGWIFTNCRKSVVETSQPQFLVFICIGAIISSSTLIALSFEAGTNEGTRRASAGCTAAPFLYSIGWVLIFSSLCAKTFRMFKIMKNCGENRQEVVSFKSMLKIVVCALAMDMAIVVSWTILNPLVYEREILRSDEDPVTGTVTIESIGQCRNRDEDGPGFWAFAGPLVGVHLTLMIITMALLYKVRGMQDRYQESKYMGFAMLLTFQTLVVGVPIAVAVGDARAIHVILIGVIAVHDIAVLSLLFFPKILFQESHSKEDTLILASLTHVPESRFGEAMHLLDEVSDPSSSTGLTEKQRSQMKLVKTLLIQRNSNQERLLHVPNSLVCSQGLQSTFLLREFAGVLDNSDLETASVSRKSVSEAAEFFDDVDGSIGEVYTLPEFYELSSNAERKHLFRLLSWSNLKRWDFSIFDLLEVTRSCGGHPLLFVGWAVLGSPYSQFAMAKVCGCSDDVTIKDFQGYDFMESKLKIPIKKLCDYLRAVESDYNDFNPYHNAIHAADVVQTLHSMIQMRADDFTVKEELFAILLSAVVHDVKHPGKNNSFQVNTHSEVALVYNDMSVLENKHAAHAFTLMLVNSHGESTLDDDHDMDLNLLSNVDRRTFAEIRKKVVEAVLQTDMAKHFAKLDAIKEILECNGDGWDSTTRWDVLMFMLHCADISNPAKGDSLFKHWTDRCLEEFFAQGDMEGKLGLPVSPNCDRKTTKKANSQIGFIKFVIIPSYEVLSLAIPKVREFILPQIESNLMYWIEQKEQDETQQTDSTL